MNNENGYIMASSPSLDRAEPWPCQLCERQGNESNVIFTLDPAKEICNACWLDCMAMEEVTE